VPVFPRAATALALLVAACSPPTRGCDICTYSATIYGRLSDAAGDPVVGASVRAVVGAGPCAAEAPTFEGVWMLADAAGRYRAQVLSPVPAPGCVRLEAARGRGPLAGAEVPAVRFKPTADASVPYDSVRVDLRVP